jgi:hypothetical protein
MSLIKYSFWYEHPIGKGVSFFVAFLVITFGFININTLGRYGYAMGLDNLWFLFICLLFLGANIRYGKQGDNWAVEYCIFGLKVKSALYQDAKIVQEGKLARVFFKSRSGEFGPSPIAFDQKSMDLVSKIFN